MEKKIFTLGNRNNPHDSSVRAPDNLNEIDKNICRRPIYEDSFGRRFHRIEHYVSDQILFSRLLKGIMPVSDIVFSVDKQEFVSYEMPIESTGDNRAEIYDDAHGFADQTILAFVFGDFDHRWSGGHNVKKGGAGEVAWFDFEGFAFFWNDTDPPPEKVTCTHISVPKR